MEEKSFMDRAMESFQRNKDLRGLDAIREGVSLFLDKLMEIANDADESDMGLYLYAMKAMYESLKSGMPGAEEAEKLVGALLSTTVITVPRAVDEREEEA